MKATQKIFKSSTENQNVEFDFVPDIFLLFISPEYKNPSEFVKNLNKKYPNASITGCSTSGEIYNTSVVDNSIVINAIKLDKTRHKITSVNINDFENSFEAGTKISQQFDEDDLKHVLIFSDGLHVNGAELVKGLTENLKSPVSVTGGLAGDGVNFKNTFTIKNGLICENEIVGLGLYGDIQVGFSSRGGWDSFGIERSVTKSEDNVVYEIDGMPALDLYKSYLGEKAKELPSSGLLFPLNLRVDDNQSVVRTILGVDESKKSLTFAGSIPEGSYIRLMKANMDRLINGASDSAKLTKDFMKEDADFALLISCVGRRLVLKQIVEEEIEVVRDVLGDKPIISGFYSYGELAPFDKDKPCRLHNQTMTITTFSE